MALNYTNTCGDAIKKAEMKNPFEPDIVLFDFRAEGLPVDQRGTGIR